MDFFDFFFPEQAQASHLRKIASQRNPAMRRRVAGNADQLDDLKDDVRFLTLVLVSILKRLSETETLSLADVKDLLSQIDVLDGAADQGVDPAMLKGILGLIEPENPGESTEEAPSEEININTIPRYRRS